MRDHLDALLPAAFRQNEYGDVVHLNEVSPQHLAKLQAKLWHEVPKVRVDLASWNAPQNELTIALAKDVHRIATTLASGQYKPASTCTIANVSSKPRLHPPCQVKQLLRLFILCIRTVQPQCSAIKLGGDARTLDRLDHNQPSRARHRYERRLSTICPKQGLVGPLLASCSFVCSTHNSKDVCRLPPIPCHQSDECTAYHDAIPGNPTA